jgi:arylsulfatase A-like enzyme
MGATGGEPLHLPTFAPALQQAGYRTAYFGKWHLGPDPAANAGWHEEHKQEDDAETTRRALDFLARQRGAAQPFALAVSYLNPHDVYQYRPGVSRPDPATPLPRSCRPDALQSKPAPQLKFMTGDQGRRIHGQPPAEYRVYRELYREKVRLYDEHLGRLLAALDESGQKSSTLAIVTSDHGDMDAHHGLIWKGPFMYEQMIRVPLLVRGPGIRPRRIDEHHAVNVDLAPTLLAYAGVPAPRAHGVSLRPLLEDAPGFRPRRTVFAEYHGKQQWTEPIRMIRTPGWKYNLYRDGGHEELYDLRRDPGEEENLAARPAHQARRRALRAELERWIEAQNDDFLRPHP